MSKRMRQVYKEIQRRLKQIDFSLLWPGFQCKDFALYNDKQVLLQDSVLEWDDRFLGNTVINYEGKLLAIWSLTDEDLADIDELTANIVHEMFHVFQKEEGECRFPDELAMLAAPFDLALFQLKQFEIELLIKAWNNINERESLMQDYCAYKKYRLERWGEALRNELYVETSEGTAEFVGLSALKQLSNEKFTAKVAAYCEILADKRYLFDIRRLGYFVGALQLLLFAETDIAFYHPIGETSLSVFEWAARNIKARKPKIEAQDEINQLAIAHQAEKETTIKSFKQAALHKIETQARIVGFDPMNMIRSGQYILCKNFIMLEIKHEKAFISGPVLLKLAASSNNVVSAYYIRV